MNPETGFLINLKQLSAILNEKVIIKMDHKNLNLDVGFMAGKIPSAENIAIAIWNEIEIEINRHNCKLHCVKVVETENNSIKYYGKN